MTLWQGTGTWIGPAATKIGMRAMLRDSGFQDFYYVQMNDIQHEWGHGWHLSKKSEWFVDSPIDWDTELLTDPDDV